MEFFHCPLPWFVSRSGRYPLNFYKIGKISFCFNNFRLAQILKQLFSEMKIFPILYHKTAFKFQHKLFLQYTWATRSRSGSNQFTLHSQWLSKNVRTEAVAASAPLTLDRIKPSRFSLRKTRTFWILANSSPSEAVK